MLKSQAPEKVLASNLVTDTCKVRISGSGDIEINVKKPSWDARISGSGTVLYKGKSGTRQFRCQRKWKSEETIINFRLLIDDFKFLKAEEISSAFFYVLCLMTPFIIRNCAPTYVLITQKTSHGYGLQKFIYSQ
jgi:hypothetical protein